MAVEFISGKDHYDKVIARVASVRKSLWIGTADIKDLHVKAGNSSEPFLAVLAKLLKNPHSSATPTQMRTGNEHTIPHLRYTTRNCISVLSARPTLFIVHLPRFAIAPNRNVLQGHSIFRAGGVWVIFAVSLCNFR